MSLSTKTFTYISLFSGAGIGCYGFKKHGFQCIATNELLEKRINIQKHNKKCKYQTGYIPADITIESNKYKIFQEIERWKKYDGIKEVDVIIATPPCQGMSVANHKKKNEQGRNSLIVESISLVKTITPRYFIFENVRTFLKTLCQDLDGKTRSIEDAININLAGKYNILSQVINFKDYGSNSSRTRTLVIGVRKDIMDITPYDIFPTKLKHKTLMQVIGKYPRLQNMGDIAENDIYHHFKKYDERMVHWIKDIGEGQSAFDNKDINKRPNQVKQGKVVLNANKNADKYRRCKWNDIAPCIHTRNDIISSQSTIHPIDNRVFSIRELMDLMTIPRSFRWAESDSNKINSLPLIDKEKFLKTEGMNIRQSIGESVPTAIFDKIANKILMSEASNLSKKEVQQIISLNSLNTDYKKLHDFVTANRKKITVTNLSKIIELTNSNRDKSAAFYTPRSICYSLVKELPSFKKDTIHIVEPAVGAGNFIPLLSQRYSNKKIILDVFDIDGNIIKLLKILNLEEKFKNLKINYFHKDFIQDTFSSNEIFRKKTYDIAIGNPPFGKITDKNLLAYYRTQNYNKRTTNRFAFFLERSLDIANYVAIITPKSLLSAPEFNESRKFIENYSKLHTIIDYGEKGFNGVKIETISLLIESNQSHSSQTQIKVESYIKNNISYINSSELFDKDFNSWLLYKDSFFKNIKDKMLFDVYDFYRDRAITKSLTTDNGKFRVLKARNLDSNKISNIQGYDVFLNDIAGLAVSKFLNSKSILIPNLSYNTRACFMPPNSIADGSVAILCPKGNFLITEEDLEYYSSTEFKKFYMIGRNLGTRSLNIDSNSIGLWGLLKERHL